MRDETHRDQRATPSGGGTQHTADELAAVFGEVRTARLALRRPRAEDGPAMYRIHGDPATYRYTPVAPDPDLATSVRALEEWTRQWEREGYGYWAVTPAGTEEVRGFGGVRRIVWRDRDMANLYYRLAPGAWGQGYAAELAREAVRLARVYLPHLPVVARVRAENIPSIRTAERAGLERRPDLDTAEHVVFALGWPAGEGAGTNTAR